METLVRTPQQVFLQPQRLIVPLFQRDPMELPDEPKVQRCDAGWHGRAEWISVTSREGIPQAGRSAEADLL